MNQFLGKNRLENITELTESVSPNLTDAHISSIRHPKQYVQICGVQ